VELLGDMEKSITDGPLQPGKRAVRMGARGGKKTKTGCLVCKYVLGETSYILGCC
jgi:hypothetical protein